jgi:hypothetical protein
VFVLVDRRAPQHVRVALRGSLLIVSKPRNPARLEGTTLANGTREVPLSAGSVADVHRELLLNRKADENMALRGSWWTMSDRVDGDHKRAGRLATRPGVLLHCFSSCMQPREKNWNVCRRQFRTHPPGTRGRRLVNPRPFLLSFLEADPACRS